MAVVTSGVWAIDIGANSLKAVHMRPGQDGPEVIGFDYVEHSRMLSVGHLSEDQKQLYKENGAVDFASCRRCIESCY